jgi:hypothetical protein
VNLYDLAEWASLVPSVRYGENPMLAPGLLRVTPGLIALLIALSATRYRHPLIRLGIIGFCLLIVIGLLPPFDFYRGQSADVNYSQQFRIAIGSGVAVLITLIPVIRGRVVQGVSLGVAGAAGLCAIMGWGMTATAFQPYRISWGIGIGLILTLVGLVGFLISTFRQLRLSRTESVKPSTP